MTKYRIPFNRTSLMGEEKEYMARVIQEGHISGNGFFTQKSEELLERFLGVSKVLLTTSGTHALEMTAHLLDIQPGDEVIVPSFTFVSTANAFVLKGAKPIFIDIRPDTLNMDEKLLPDYISSRTKAVLPVHYAGIGCEMNAILKLGEENGVAVIEDNAHGLFGKYKEKYLGTFGKMAALSFHETKNFTCGEGGALLINDPTLTERAEIFREKGTDRKKFFKGQVDKYTWVDMGSNFLLSEILAAFLLAQLEKRELILNRRKEIWTGYRQELEDWASENQVQLPVIPPYCEPTYHIFYLLLPSSGLRQALIEHLKTRGILGVFHYQPLHLSEMGRKLGGEKGDCPITEEICERILRLPFYNDLKREDQESVIHAVREFKV